MPHRAPEPRRVSASRGLTRASTVSSGVLARPTSAELAKPNGLDDVIQGDGPSREPPARDSRDLAHWIPETPLDSTEAQVLAQVRDLERRLQEQNHLYWESAKRKEEDLHVAKAETSKLQKQLQELQQRYEQSEQSAHAELVSCRGTLQNVVHEKADLRSEYKESRCALDSETQCVALLRQELKEESDERQLETRELLRQQESSAKLLSELEQERDSREAERTAAVQARGSVAALRLQIAGAEDELSASKSEALELRQACLSSREEASELRVVSSKFQDDFAELSHAFWQECQEVSEMQSALCTAKTAAVEAKEALHRTEEETREQLLSSKSSVEHEAQRACLQEELLQRQTNELQSHGNELKAAKQKVKELRLQEESLHEQVSSSRDAYQRLKTEMNDFVRESSVNISKQRLRADEAESCLEECEARETEQQVAFVSELAKAQQCALQESTLASEEGRLAAEESEQLSRTRAEMHEAEKQHAESVAAGVDIQERLRLLRERNTEICDALASAKNAERVAEASRGAAEECAAKTGTELRDATNKEEASAKAAAATLAECHKLQVELRVQQQSHEQALAQKDCDLREIRSHAGKQLEKLRVSTEEWAAQETRREHDLEVANQNVANADQKIKELRTELAEARSRFQKLQSNEKELRQARAEADHCARLTHQLEAQLDESRDKLRRAELRQEAKGEELEMLKARSSALQNQMQDLRGKLSVERLGRPRGVDAGGSKGDMWLYSEPTGFFAPGGGPPAKPGGTAPCEAQNEDKSGGLGPPMRSHSVGQLPNLPRPPMPAPGAQSAILPPMGGPSLKMGWASNAARTGSSKDPSPRISRASKVEKVYCK